MRPLATDESGSAVSLEELDLESFGAANYTQLTWRSLIDGWACTPVHAVKMFVQPMRVVRH